LFIENIRPSLTLTLTRTASSVRRKAARPN